MSVTLEIRSDSKLSVEEIVSLKNLSYGLSDNNYVLHVNEIGEYTILFDATCMGRGFELWFEDTTICLRMPLPTTGHEIGLFYSLAECICQKTNVEYVLRDDGIVPLSELNKCVSQDKEASLNALKNIEKSIYGKEYTTMTIFGVLNPIDIGKKECNIMKGDLKRFEKFLHQLQSKDVFYAGPHYYKRNDESIFGMYFVGENIDTVVPKKAHAPFGRMKEVDSYYVRIPDNNDIPYDDFIANVKVLEEYDSNHVIVCLSPERIDYLSSHYTVDFNTNVRRKRSYFGKVLDDGRNHLYKIKKMNLEVDELASLNHLAVFLKWMGEHHLLSDRLKRDVPDIDTILKDDTLDLRRFMLDEPSFDGTIREQHFNDIGREFALLFYRFNDDNGYPNCVDMYALSVLGEEKYHCEEYKNEAYLFAPYSKKYEKGLSKYIDKAWKVFKK